MTKPTRATPESGSTPLSSRVDPILTPAKAEREAAANRSVDTSDTLKQTVTKATPSVSDETLALFGRRNDFATRYHLTRRGKIKRLGQITRIVEQFDVLHGLTPVKMRLMFEALGPTFVKVGQILSMRSEILPQSFCDELAKLRADADPMPYSTVLDVLAAEYGRPADEVFAHIDPKPLGSASLAQVHRATLKTGEDVAIKVQRPGVRETMAQDVSIMRSIAKAATKVIRTSQIVDLKGVVEELLDQMRVPKVRFRPAEGEGYAFLQPGRCAEVLSGGVVLGWVGEIHPDARDVYGIDIPVVAFELNLDALLSVAGSQEAYHEFSQFPSVEHDLAIVVDDSVTCEDLERRLRSAGGKLLVGVRLFDVYRDKERVGEGKKSMAFALTYRSDDHTLTSEEVEKTHQKLVTKVCKAVGGEVRS